MGAFILFTLFYLLIQKIARVAWLWARFNRMTMIIIQVESMLQHALPILFMNLSFSINGNPQNSTQIPLL